VAAKSPSKLKEVARPRSARGTGPKELVAAVAGGKIVSSRWSKSAYTTNLRQHTQVALDPKELVAAVAGWQDYEQQVV
jgi:hypothetical protein